MDEEKFRNRSCSCLFRLMAEQCCEIKGAYASCIIFHKYVDFLGFETVFAESKTAVFAAILLLSSKLSECTLSLQDCILSAVVIVRDLMGIDDVDTAKVRRHHLHCMLKLVLRSLIIYVLLGWSASITHNPGHRIRAKDSPYLRI